MDLKNASNPIVSIVIVTFNKWELTETCLKSIKTNVSLPYEIIILDNASTDQTREELKNLTDVKVVLSNENLQFLKGNNLATESAVGEYILFLNNDTEVKSSTVESMVETIRNVDRCEAVVSKFIYPNGLLQEAGSIIWNDGSAYGYEGGRPF